MVVFRMRQAVFADLRDSRESTNIFPVLLARFQQILYIPVREFQVHRKGFDSFVDAHDPIITKGELARRYMRFAC